MLFVLYGFETRSLMLREEQRLRVFENKVLRKIFGPKRDEVTGEWRRLHKEELYELYCTPYITYVIKPRNVRWVRHVAHMGDKRGTYRVFLGRLEGRRSLGGPRHGWENNIKMEEVGWRGIDWIDLAQDWDRWRALVNAVVSLQVA